MIIYIEANIKRCLHSQSGPDKTLKLSGTLTKSDSTSFIQPITHFQMDISFIKETRLK